MDHAASLPYVLAKTNFNGRVYMTHATKAIYKWTMQDAVRVQNTHTTTSQNSGSDAMVSQLYSEQDILSTLPQIQTISFNTTHTHNGIKITPYPAGHVLGACMYLIEIAGLNVLFTGDYSRENDRHLIPASVPRGVKVDCLITESTFGISTHTPLHERETALTKSITSILNRGGRALLPVSAVGQTQNLLLILEDYWNRHPEFRQYPIYYASNLARKCMVVFQTYIDSMNASIRSKFAEAQANGGTGGPWDFEFIRNLRHGAERFEDVGGCVMLAAPGMMQNGTSRAFLEKWAPDAKNGVVATGYSVEGTMGKQILQEPDSIPSVMNKNTQNTLGKRPGGPEQTTMIPRRCTVQEVSFAAHVDGQENREFIEEVDAKVVILVHGEKHNMNRMKSRLLSLQKFRVFSPANCEEVRIPFRQDKVARVVGRLASEVQPPQMLLTPPGSAGEEGDDEGEAKKRRQEGEEAIMNGVLVQNDFKLSLMAPEDLKEYAGLTTTTILCRQRITLAAAGVGLIQWALEGTFGNINPSTPGKQTNGATENGDKGEADEEVERKDPTTFDIMGGAVKVICRDQGEVELEWEGNAMNDSIADAVMAVLLTLESSPAAVKHSSKAHSHGHGKEEQPQYDAFGDSPVVEKKMNGFGDDDNNANADADTEMLGDRPNPFNPRTAEERLNRLFMFLEAQFGSDAITPIAEPRLPSTMTSEGEMDDVALAKARNLELARLHDLGIPVPGVEVKCDDKVAKVWLEGLEVECASKILGERVKAVMDRGIGVVAPVWV